MEGEMRKSRREILAEHREALLARAARMRVLSLAPNMGEKVGAAILLRDGTMLCGFNTPHASMCAEGTALIGLEKWRMANVVAVAIDGASICWSHLAGLRKWDDDFNPILVVHCDLHASIGTMALDGELIDAGLVAFVSVNPVLP